MALFINDEFLKESKNSSKLIKETTDLISKINNCLFEMSDEFIQRRTDFQCPILKSEDCSTNDNFIVIDLETTGLSSFSDRIIELSAIKYEKGIPVEKFHTYINPEVPISTEATEINQITNDMLINSPRIDQILPAFDRFIDGSIIVGHNLEFDIKFLHCSGSSILDQGHEYFDTLRMAEKLLKSKKRCSDYDVLDYKLPTLCKYYGITLVKNHSALYDSFATGELFIQLCNEED